MQLSTRGSCILLVVVQALAPDFTTAIAILGPIFLRREQMLDTFSHERSISNPSSESKESSLRSKVAVQSGGVREERKW